MMNYWSCSKCDYVFKAKEVPETCPNCHTKCTFSDVTCYIPECGGPKNFDSRLIAQRLRESKKDTK